MEWDCLSCLAGGGGLSLGTVQRVSAHSQCCAAHDHQLCSDHFLFSSAHLLGSTHLWRSAHLLCGARWWRAGLLPCREKRRILYNIILYYIILFILPLLRSCEINFIDISDCMESVTAGDSEQ